MAQGVRVSVGVDVWVGVDVKVAVDAVPVPVGVAV